MKISNKISFVDKLIQLICISTVLFKFTLQELIEIIIYYFYLSNYIDCFTFTEKLIIMVTFQSLPNQNNNILIATKYNLLTPRSNWILIDLLINLLYFNIDIAGCIKRYYDEILINRYQFVLFVFIALTTIVVQVIIKNVGKNLKRKLFHISAFLIFFVHNKFLHLTAEIFLYLLYCLTINYKKKALITYFANEKDSGKYVLSHIILISACLYIELILPINNDITDLKRICNKYMNNINYQNYISILISICFYDSFASIIGKAFGSNNKSIIGMVGGLIMANAIYFMIFGKLNNFKYFIFIAIIEYHTKSNDNIVIPFASYYFFKTRNIIKN
ncbi:hypothetical protein TCON_2011 [Astathelohania contejeani]|uniref:Dolichol kinase n=1 Tax=Astathelohania contejeani TaxID=164912 RepID=A0ABQ7HX74_9MICR|nr:hypothetical protein TCON_2011 [Thelohania contejeani]